MKALLLAWHTWLASVARIAKLAWLAPAPAWALPPASPRSPSKLTLEQQARRGAEARSIWENPLFADAVRGVHERLAYGRRQVPMADDRMHTRLILAEQTFGQVLAALQELMDTGDLARHELFKRQSTSARMSQAFRRGLRA